MNPIQKFIPIALVAMFAFWLAYDMIPKRTDGGLDLDGAARILVSADGRVKPLDTIARSELMLIKGRQTVKLGEEKVPPIMWLLDVMASATDRHRLDEARMLQYEVFEINHEDILAMVGIDDPQGRRWFSYGELLDAEEDIIAQAQEADRLQRDGKPITQVQTLIRDLGLQMTRVNRIALHTHPVAEPPLVEGGEWRTLDEVIHGRRPPNAAGAKLREILIAYRQGNEAEFNRGVAGYNEMLAMQFPAEHRRAGVEIFYNEYAPFYKGTVLYFTAFVIACGALLAFAFDRSGHWAQSLRWSAGGLIVLVFLLHTAAIIARIYLHQRPPVTNLYASAVFIGWACVPIGLAVEWFMKRLSFGLIAASLAGFVTLIIAHQLALQEGDTMKNMQAVLDTNFWLATHVPTITIGYSAVFLAGLMGIIFILLGVFTPLMRKDIRRDFTKAVYGVACFALLTSFVGTVLGGIWADQSWGRFWGWDPKENGAVLIVLIIAIILHARWAGLIRERGIMVLAVFGNIVTAWSWFGTNMLGAGLHAYGGAGSAQITAIWTFVISQLIIMAIGMVPQRFWISYAMEAEAEAAARNRRARQHALPKAPPTSPRPA